MALHGSMARCSMSRKIALRVPMTIMVRDRDVAVLAIIAGVSKHPEKPSGISLKTVARRLNASSMTARRALNACREAGYLIIASNKLHNGAQLENSYALTQQGMDVLNAARAAGIVSGTGGIRDGKVIGGTDAVQNARTERIFADGKDYQKM